MLQLSKISLKEEGVSETSPVGSYEQALLVVQFYMAYFISKLFCVVLYSQGF